MSIMRTLRFRPSARAWLARTMASSVQFLYGVRAAMTASNRQLRLGVGSRYPIQYEYVRVDKHQDFNHLATLLHLC